VAFTTAQAGEFSPLSPDPSGRDYTKNLNRLLGGEGAILPQIDCRSQPYLPTTIVNHRVHVCHLCAPTNPCTLGTRDLLALGVCTAGDTCTAGSSGHWDCNLGVTLDGQSSSFPLSDPVVVATSPTTVLTANLDYGISPTGHWRVRYVLTATVSTSTTCDLALYRDGLSFPSLVTEVAAASSTTMPVQLVYETLKAGTLSTASTSVTLVAQASDGSSCTVLSSASLLSGPATVLTITAVPG
jgi:hypothetical protein